MTKEQLSDKSTVSSDTIKRLEDGHQGGRILLVTITNLARALAVPADFFLTDDGKAPGLPAQGKTAYAKRRLPPRSRRG